MSKKSSRTIGYSVHGKNGFLIGFYRAFSRTDVERALIMEWADEAADMRIERAPLHVCGDNELSKDRVYDLTTNAGWASLITSEEVRAMA